MHDKVIFEEYVETGKYVDKIDLGECEAVNVVGRLA